MGEPFGFALKFVRVSHLTMKPLCNQVKFFDAYPVVSPHSDSASALSAGIGYASIVIVSLLNIYYIVILAWGVYYLFQVCSQTLPLIKSSDLIRAVDSDRGQAAFTVAPLLLVAINCFLLWRHRLLLSTTVFSTRAALGQVQPLLEQRPLHRGHQPHEQVPHAGGQRLQPDPGLPRHRVLGVSFLHAPLV